MRSQFLLFCLAFACLTSGLIEAKTVFRRKDKISENFKQLDLPDEEIDPNVAPPEPQKVETIDPENAIIGSASAPSGDGDGAEAEGANEAVDEAENEVEQAVAAPAVTAAPAAAAPAAASSSSASSAASSASAAVSTTVAPVKNEDDPSAISKYCKCTDSHCDCCRNFNLPLIPVRGPGCAKVTYLGNERMSVSIKYGDITLATRTISGRNAKPICVGLPGGYSKFCGRVYGLSKAQENFKACLGFELRAEDEVEAALRVSCFKFGPEGLRVAEAEPLPSQVIKDEDEEDDGGLFGFGAGGDDDDDYDADADEEVEEDEADEEDDDDDAIAAPEDADYGGFSLGAILDELTDDDDEKPAAAAAAAAAVKPAAPVAVGATRNAQSKDDKGTETAAVSSVVAAVEASHTSAADATVSAEEAAIAAAAAAVTPSPAVDAPVTVKSKKGKKGKKNKKKKAASSEESFAFELIKGILDFFN